MINIYDIKNEKFIHVEIVRAGRKLPLKKSGWKFNRNQFINDRNSQIFVLRVKYTQKVEGILQLKIENDMLIMHAIELAPHNIGNSKEFEQVAGCLLAFACRESFKIEGSYKGFLIFISKTNLIEWYMEKYGARLALGQRMYIDDKAGQKLIKKYLE